MGTVFCGDVVLDSFNKAFSDEDYILDQIYNSIYVRNIITMILIFYTIKRKCIHTNFSTKTQLSNMSSLCGS